MVRLIMKHLCILLLAVGMLQACSKDIDLRSGEKFLHALQPDAATCDAIRLQYPVYNCFQALEFLDGKRVMVVFTDIQYLGSYKKRGNTIEIRFDDASGLPDSELELEITGAHTLRDGNREWQRWKGPGNWDFYE